MNITKEEAIAGAIQLLEAQGYSVTKGRILPITVDGVFDPQIIGEKSGVYKAINARMGGALFEKVAWKEGPAGPEHIGKVRAIAMITLVVPQ